VRNKDFIVLEWGKKSAACVTRLRLKQMTSLKTRQLFLPGAFLVAIGAKLFAPLVFIDFAFTTFL
jgi:hypothetical protein